MKGFKLSVDRDPQETTSHPFQVHHMGLHELMKPCQVDRPQGTGDYLFMLFHSPVLVRSREGEGLWPANSLVVWRPQDGHYYGDTSRPWGHSWLHFGGREINRILRAARVTPNTRIALSDPSLLERFLLDLAAELNAWLRPDAILLRNLFENFVRAVGRQTRDRAQLLPPPVLLQIRGHLEQHFAEPLTLSALSRRAGWSPPHLCAEFKRFFGVPVMHYVQRLRMNHAAHLLRDQNGRVGEIAALVGYPDPYAFSKMFKRSFRVSPRAYRQRWIGDAARG